MKWFLLLLFYSSSLFSQAYNPTMLVGDYQTTGGAPISLAPGIVFQVSTQTGGSIPCPRKTQAEIDAKPTPTEGECAWNLDTSNLVFFNGSAWALVGGGAGVTRSYRVDTIANLSIDNIAIPYFQNPHPENSSTIEMSDCGTVTNDATSGTSFKVTSTTPVYLTFTLNAYDIGAMNQMGISINPTVTEMDQAFNTIPIIKRGCIVSQLGIAGNAFSCSFSYLGKENDEFYVHSFPTVAWANQSQFNFSVLCGAPSTSGGGGGAGTGDVLGPTSATPNRVAQFSTTTGRVLKETPYTIPATVCLVNQVLKADATGDNFICADDLTGSGGTGDVAGPGASVDNEIAVFSGTSGKFIKQPPGGILIGNVPTMGSAAGGANRLIISGGANKSLSASGIEATNLVTMATAFSAASRIAVAAGNNRTLTETGYRIPTTICSSGQILKSDGVTDFTCQVDNAGTGDVVGPGASLDNEVALFDGITGKIVRGGSGITVSSSNTLNLGGGVINTGAGQFSRSALILEETGFLGDTFTLKAPADIVASYELTFPAAAPPAANQILQSDASGQFSWIDTPGGNFVGAPTPTPTTNFITGWDTVSGDNLKEFNTGAFRLFHDPGAHSLELEGDTTGPIFLNLTNIGGDAPEVRVSAAPTGEAKIELENPTTKTIVHIEAGSDSGISLGDTAVDLSSFIEFRGNNSGFALVNNVGRTENQRWIFPAAMPTSGQILAVGAISAPDLELEWKSAVAVPLCTGSQRLSGNGTVLSCLDNTYNVPPALDIDWSTGHVFYKAVGGVQTFTFSNQSNGQRIVLGIENTTAGDLTMAFPASKWPGGLASGLVKANSYTLFTFTRINNVNLVTKIEDIK